MLGAGSAEDGSLAQAGACPGRRGGRAAPGEGGSAEGCWGQTQWGRVSGASPRDPRAGARGQ